MHVVAIACITALVLYLVRTPGELLHTPILGLVNAIKNPVVDKIYDCLLCSSFWSNAIAAAIYWVAFLDDKIWLMIPLMTVITIYAYKILDE